VAFLARASTRRPSASNTLVQSHKSLLANASHELRSPLARIRMGLELMDPNPAALARRDHAQHRELDQLIDEILLASRLDAREADIGTIEPVDLTGLAAEECARADAELDLAEGEQRRAGGARACPSCCAARSATCWRTRAATATGR
jgi:two-component system OmpR family sensor kinase